MFSFFMPVMYLLILYVLLYAYYYFNCMYCFYCEGRWEDMGRELFRLSDRLSGEMCLAPVRQINHTQRCCLLLVKYMKHNAL